jgi:hypothetical protein
MHDDLVHQQARQAYAYAEKSVVNSVDVEGSLCVLIMNIVGLEVKGQERTRAAEFVTT